MNYIVPLLKLSYWFSPYPIPFLPLVDKALLIFFSAIFIAGIACAVYAKFGKKLPKDLKKLIRRYAEALSTAGVFGLLLYSFAWQSIPFLSMRIWYVAWLAIFGGWVYSIVRFQLRELPAQRKMRAEQTEREKWMPKKK